MAQVVEQYKWGPYSRKVVYDRDEPEKFGIFTEADVTQVLETNHQLRAEGLQNGHKATNKLLARVPLTIYEQSVREGWGDDDWKRWLNDPDNKLFRVWEGAV